MAQKELVELSAAECLELLKGERVGRLVYQDESGPVAEPVNFAVAGESLVIRTEGGAKRAAVARAVVAFEVDRIDPERRAGWSVIVRGEGEEVPLDEVPALVHELRLADSVPPQPWASGIHKVWLRIRIDRLSGRRLGRESSPLVI